MLKHLLFCVSISIIPIILSQNIDNEDQEDRRNLSTDILDYVLKELNYEWKNIVVIIILLFYYIIFKSIFIILTTLFREERIKMMKQSLLIFLVLSRRE